MKQIGEFASRGGGPGITLALGLSILLGSLGTSIANIALPTLAAAFSAPFAEVQAVVVAYLAALTVSVVAAGRLGDVYGLKCMLVLGLGLFAIASLLCAAAAGLWGLIGARVLQGIGAAFLMTLAMALMRHHASETGVGKAMGLLGTLSALGTALGPSLGGMLIPVTGWPGIFWVQVPLAVAALVLVAIQLPGDRGAENQPSASAGAVMTRDLASNLCANVLVAAVMMTTLVVGPFYLALGLGLDPTQTGFVMAVGPVISIFGGVLSGRLVDARGCARVLVMGLILLTAGTLSLAILPNALGLGGYVLSIAILTPGYQLFQAANNTVALADIGRDRRGTVSGLLNLSRNLGLIAGASLMGGVFTLGAGTDVFASASVTAIQAGMRLTFLSAGIMMLLTIAIVFGLSRRVPGSFGGMGRR